MGKKRDTAASNSVGTNVVRFKLKRHKWLEDLAIQQAIRRDPRPTYLLAKEHGVSFALIERIRVQHTEHVPLFQRPPLSKAARKKLAERTRIGSKKGWAKLSAEQRTARTRAAVLKRWARVREERALTAASE